MRSRFETEARGNGSFLSSLVPLFQNESKCETFLMKMANCKAAAFLKRILQGLQILSPALLKQTRTEKAFGKKKETVER